MSSGTERSAPKTAVVLSGGGAKAAYQIGVLQALFEGASGATSYRPLEVDVFTGTSAGAFNAAHLVSHGDTGPAATRRLMDVWLERIARSDGRLGNGVFRLRAAPLALFDHTAAPDLRSLAFETGRDAGFWAREALDRGAAFLRRSGPLATRLLDTLDLSTVFSTEPFHQLIRETIDLDGLRRSHQELHLAAANWATGRVRLFSKEDIMDRVGLPSILASASIPGVFPPVAIEGQLYVDGSVVMATPLRPAIRSGAEEIHMIYLDTEAGHLPLPEVANSIDTMSRLFLFTVAGRVNGDIAAAAAINREVQLLADLEALGLDLSAESEAVSLLSPHSRVLARVREGQPYRQLTIHRYRLRHDQGGGEDVLDFHPDYLRHLIRTGYRDAAEHDCEAEGCVLPDRPLPLLRQPTNPAEENFQPVNPAASPAEPVGNDPSTDEIEGNPQIH